MAATTLALSAVVSCIGIGFQRGAHSFAIATGGVLTLFDGSLYTSSALGLHKNYTLN